MTRKLLTALCIALVLCAALPLVAGPKAHIAREKIEWCDIWINDGAETKLPRVLLIGDSITRGYTKVVEGALKGKASVARLATSKSLCDPAYLDELKLVLSQYNYDVIHWNNGLHGWDYTEAEYKTHFPEALALIRKLAPKAKIIWASSTPTIDPAIQRYPLARIVERNRIAAEIAKQEGLPIDDLFTLVKDHPEYHVADGVHFNDQGYKVLGAQVAGMLK